MEIYKNEKPVYLIEDPLTYWEEHDIKHTTSDSAIFYKCSKARYNVIP